MSEVILVEDDLFLFAPSMQLVEASKSIGQAPLDALTLKNLDHSILAQVDPEGFARIRRKGVDKARRKFDGLQVEVRQGMKEVLYGAEGYSSIDELRTALHLVMRPAWRRAFELGIEATGVRTDRLTPDDYKLMKSFVAREVRFLNKMVEAVYQGEFKMALDKRIELYVRTLESLYDTGRVLGLPTSTSLFWWTGPGQNDGRACDGCEYLFEQSPYTIVTLPTTPRAGSTPCRANCRDKLLVRSVGALEVQERIRSGKTRDDHLAVLASIMRKGRR